MSEKAPTSTKNFSLDWLVQGVLTKLGDTFDRFTGRGWKPSSTLATSELIERLKQLLDAEARDEANGIKFVPNTIRLKMQWDKFSTDSDESLKKLEHELLIAAVDHINDRRYHTHSPLSLEVKPDYFVTGVKLYVGFSKPGEEEHEAEMNVTLPGVNVSELLPDATADVHREPEAETFVARFTVNGEPRTTTLTLKPGQRVSVGRSKENALAIEDVNVSKVHASLALNSGRELVVADTGSTNGTFVNGERIPYGKAVVLGPEDNTAFGSVEVAIEHIRRIPAPTIALGPDVGDLAEQNSR